MEKPPLGDPSVVKSRCATHSDRDHQSQTPSPVGEEDLLLLLRIPREAPVAGAAQSASAETLQNPDVSLEQLPNTMTLEELIPESPQTAPHETTGSSSSTFTSTCQEPVSGAAGSTYAPALQESDAPSSVEFVDSSSEQKLVGVISSLEKLLHTTSYEESNIANPQTVTQNTIDVSSRTFQSRSEKFVAGAADSMSVLTLQEPDVSSSDEYLDSSSEESSITDSPRTVPLNTIDDSPPTLGPNILIYYPAKSFEVFYIRIDRRGSLWTYPNVGGPFQSTDETENAINSFLDLWQCETRISTIKGGPNSSSRTNTCHEKWHLAQAVLDQFNDQNNLFGDHAHELEDLLGKQIIYEKHRWYYHLNFTTKQKEADYDHSTGNKLFFAEVSHMQGKKFWEVNCCCMIEFEAKGGHCFGCKNNGSHGMQHPVEADAYTGGHLDVYLPFDFDALSSSDNDDGEYEDKDEDEEEEDDEFEVW